MIRKLTELCNIQYGYAFDSTEFTEDSSYLPLVRIRDVKRGYSETYFKGEYPEEYVLHAGDLLVGMDGEFNIARWKSRDALLNQRVCKITAKEGTNEEYLRFALSRALKEIENRTAFVTVKHLSAKELNKLELRIPVLLEQSGIAEVLSNIEQVITLRSMEIQRLDELIKARFVELFGDCRLNPKGWNTVPLGDIAEVGSSKRVFVEELKEAGIPFYRGTEVGALAEGKTVIPELFITEEHYNELVKATGKPEPGDLLMPSICPDGRIWVVDTDKPFYFKDGRVLWVHGIDKRFDPVFLLYTLKDRIMTDYGSIASGTTFAELKIFALKQCQVFDVPIEEQRSFAAFIAQVDKSKVAVQKALDEAQVLFDSLMQEYFG